MKSLWLFFSGMFSTLITDLLAGAPFLGTAIGFASLTLKLNIFLPTFYFNGIFNVFFLRLFKPATFKFSPNRRLGQVNFKYFLGIILLLTFFWLLTVIDVNFTIQIYLYFYQLYFSQLS